MNANALKEVVLGLDVAKGKVDACLVRADGVVIEECFVNTRRDHERLLAWLERHRSGAAVVAGLESTGPYSRVWRDLLHLAGHAVCLLNPARGAA